MEQIGNIVDEFAKLRAKLPELRDLFWLKIDRYSEADQQRGAEFDEKFNRKLENLSRVINGFTSFIQKSFAPSAEDVAKERALEKLEKAVEILGPDSLNDANKEGLLKMFMEMELKKGIHRPRGAYRAERNSFKNEMMERLRTIPILNGENFSEEFLQFYGSLDPTPETHNNQKQRVRQYLLGQGYDESLVNGLKGAGWQVRRPSEKLAVIFPDGTEISERKTTETLVKVIRKIGIQKVFDLQMKCDRELLVSQTPQVMKNPQFVEDGYYINSHSSTQAKKRQLEYISDRLNLDLKVEILEK